MLTRTRLPSENQPPEEQVQCPAYLTCNKVILGSLIEMVISEDRTYFKEKFNISKMQIQLANRLKLNGQHLS